MPTFHPLWNIQKTFGGSKHFKDDQKVFSYFQAESEGNIGKNAFYVLYTFNLRPVSTG